MHKFDLYNLLKSAGYNDQYLTEGQVAIPLGELEKLIVKRAAKANLPKPKNEEDNDYYGLYGLGLASGAYFSYLASPAPKPYVAKNTSKCTSVLSDYCRNTEWGKVNMTKRRYTHTVNGTPRYAFQRGTYIGRWGTRILGPLGAALIVYDVASIMYYYREEIDFGLEERQRLLELGLMPPR